MDRTVYIIQETIGRDYSSALKYGRIEFILGSEDRSGILPARSLAFLRSKLRNFTKEDYIVWAGGDPMSPVLAGIALGELAFHEINYLRWERIKNPEGLPRMVGYYIPGKLILRHIAPNKEEVFR